MSLSPPQLCVTAHRTSIFLLAVSAAGLNNPKLVPEPLPGALWGLFINPTMHYKLNTATVFCASPFFFFTAIFLTSLSFSGRLLCWCSCLLLMPVKKSGWGWKWWEEQVCCLSDKFCPHLSTMHLILSKQSTPSRAAQKRKKTHSCCQWLKPV